MIRPIGVLLVVAVLLLGLAAGAGSAAAAGSGSAESIGDGSAETTGDGSAESIGSGSAESIGSGSAAVIGGATDASTGVAAGSSELRTDDTGVGTAPPTGSVGANVQSQDEEHDDVVHEHPASAEDATDVDLAEWLAEHFQVSIEESAAAMEEGRFDDARGEFDEEYQQRLDQYSQIAPHTDRSTGNASDPRTRDEVAVGEFEAVRETQIELAATLTAYDDTVEEYESARDAGEEERALELARETVALSEAVQANATELRERYSRIESVLNRDLSAADTAIQDTVARTRSTSNDVAAETFSDTTLIVDAGDYRVSAGDSIHVEGQLLDADGDPIEGATIALSDPVEPAAGDVAGGLGGATTIGSGATTTVETDADGSFELEHRSTYLPLFTDQLVVEYRPDRLAPHRAARTSIGVTVEQVRGDLTVEGVPDAMEYGADVGVEVVAAADGERVPGVPVRLVIGDETVAGATDADGTLDLSTAVPRGVPAGAQSLRVEVPADGWSVAFEPHSESVDVVASETTLTADAEAARDSGVLVSGRLETTDGAPVAAAPVTIAADGAGTVQRASSDGGSTATDGPITVRTGEDGSYAATIDGASTADAVTVSYAESESNLNDASTTTALEVDDSGLLGTLTNPIVLAGLGALVVAAVGGLLVWRRRDSDADAGDDDPEPEPAESDEETAIERDPLAVAAGQAPNDPSTATVLAYGVGRSALNDELGVSPDATHREFYQACKADGLDPEVVAAADRLTDCYEEAAFAPGQVNEQTAYDAISAAKELRR